MKNKPTRIKLPVLTQLCKLIPPHLVPKLARKHGIHKQARTFTAWSHVVSLLFAQLTLRKEAGSLLLEKGGSLLKVAEFLRNDMQSAREHYVGRKERIEVQLPGLG